MTYCDPWSWKPLINTDKVNRDRLLANVELEFNNIMSLDEISRLPRNVEDDEFFEILIRKINKAVLELQCNSTVSEKLRINAIKSELNQLKKNYSTLTTSF